jgi:hypothetical protein
MNVNSNYNPGYSDALVIQNDALMNFWTRIFAAQKRLLGLIAEQKDKDYPHINLLGLLRDGLSMYAIIAMCIDPQIRKSLERFARRKPNCRIRIELWLWDIDGEANNHDRFITTDAIVAGAAQISNILGRFRSTSISLSCRVARMSAIPLGFVPLPAPLCKYIESVYFRTSTPFDADNDAQDESDCEQWRRILVEFQTHLPKLTSLMSVYFFDVDSNALVGMSTVLPTWRSPQACHYTFYGRGALSRRGVAALGKLLKKIEWSKNSLSLHRFRFATANKVQTFCAALKSRRSKDLALTMSLMEFPPKTEEMVARALTNLLELHIYCSSPLWSSRDSCARFLGALGRFMSEPSCNLRVLKFSCLSPRAFNIDWDTHLLLMQGALPGWKLQELEFSLVEWTPTLVKVISAFLRETKHLRKLSIHCICRPSVNMPAEFIAALDRPDHSLEELSFGDESERALVSEWWLLFHFIMKLNNQRRLHGRRLSEIGTAKQFVAALQEVDHECLIEFMRRNEFNLPELFQKYGGSV